MKSETSLEILSIIARFPGITPSAITDKIWLKKNTMNYHINKLRKNNLILSQKKGRNLLIYPVKEIKIEIWYYFIIEINSLIYYNLYSMINLFNSVIIFWNIICIVKNSPFKSK